MTAPDVTAFLDLAEELGVRAWVAGGWGVDALLGEQTQRHSDLDVVIDARQAALVVQQLTLRGFEHVSRDGRCAWHFALGDPHGREIDLHLVEFDADGRVRYGPDETIPAAALDRVGTIAGRTVACLAPQYQQL